MPDVEAARRWFDEMAFSYPKPRPASGDPDQIKAWNSRGPGWARTVDLEGFDTALTAVMEDAVDRGILEHAGFDASGRIVYRSLIYEGD